MGLKEVYSRIRNRRGNKSGVSVPIIDRRNLGQRLDQAFSRKTELDEQESSSRRQIGEEAEQDRKTRTAELERLANKFTIPLATDFKRLKPFYGKGEISQKVELSGTRGGVDKITITLMSYTEHSQDKAEGDILQFQISNRERLEIYTRSYSFGAAVRKPIDTHKTYWRREAEETTIKIITNNECHFKREKDLDGDWIDVR